MARIFVRDIIFKFVRAQDNWNWNSIQFLKFILRTVLLLVLRADWQRSLVIVSPTAVISSHFCFYVQTIRPKSTHLII